MSLMESKVKAQNHAEAVMDNRPRCKKCQDGGLGTLLSEVTVSIKCKGPNIPIAKMVPCCRCSYLQGIWLIPGREMENELGRYPSVAQENGITVGMITKCLSQMFVESFTLEELKSGKVHGASVNVKRVIDYNPDKYIEPEELPL
jgi:hypothetical protein